MAYLLVPLIIGFFWLWTTGRLRGVTLDDAIALSLLLLGLRLLTTGRPLIGGAMIAGGIGYGAFRRGRFARKPPPMPVEDARRLLGVSREAGEIEIKQAHRRLIARVHPDAGGTEELARRLNAARDALIAERRRGTSSRREPS